MSDEEGEQAQQVEQAQQAQQAGQAEQLGGGQPPSGPADESLPGSPKAADEPPAAAAALAAGGEHPPGQQAAAPQQTAAQQVPPKQPAPQQPQQPPPSQQHSQQHSQQQAQPQPQLQQGIALQSSEDVEAAAASLPAGGTVLFSGRCQWVTPKRVLPGQLQITATQMHFIADMAGASPGISAWLSGPAGNDGSIGSNSAGSGSAGQLGDGAEGAAGAAAEQLPPKRRHHRWQLGGLTEVHHRQAGGHLRVCYKPCLCYVVARCRCTQ